MQGEADGWENEITRRATTDKTVDKRRGEAENEERVKRSKALVLQIH